MQAPEKEIEVMQAPGQEIEVVQAPGQEDKMIMFNRHILRLTMLSAGLWCCGSHHDVTPAAPHPSAVVPSPRGYNLGDPKKFVLGESLHEITGITFLRNNPDTLYAVERETGRLYHFHPGSGGFSSRKFGKPGDYQDVTILNDAEIVVLRGDGSLVVMPLSFLQGGDSRIIHIYPHILPKGEYGSLFCDAGGRLIALCKNCPGDDQRQQISGYVLQYDPKHLLSITGRFFVMASGSNLTGFPGKNRFRPSCLARNPVTREWYIMSAASKALVVLDDQWKVKDMYQLNPALFKQPEGLAFDRQGNMYISNEGMQGNANVLLFAYKP